MDKRIPGLDGLRALSAIGVLMLHVGLFQLGWMGVQVFYALSGFLITGILLHSKGAEESAGSLLKRFYYRRSLRILPLYFAYIILFAVMSFILGDRDSLSLLSWLATYTFNIHRALHPDGAVNLCEHLWSLSVEEQFYMFWPFLVLFLSKRNFRIVALGVVVLSPAARSLVPLVAKHPTWDIYFLTPFQLDGFAVGAVLSTFSRDELRSKRVPFLSFVLCACALGLFANRHLSHFGFTWLLEAGNDTWVWGYSLVSLCAAALILECATGSSLSRWLDIALLRYFGRISYGFYVWHSANIRMMSLLLSKLDANHRIHEQRSVVFVFSLASTTLIASLSFRYLEQPFLRYKDRFFHERGTVIEASSPIIQGGN